MAKKILLAMGMITIIIALFIAASSDIPVLTLTACASMAVTMIVLFAAFKE